jgi:hypothetical protein
MDRGDAGFYGLTPDIAGEINLIAGRADAGADDEDQILGQEMCCGAERANAFGDNAEFGSFFPGME